MARVLNPQGSPNFISRKLVAQDNLCSISAQSSARRVPCWFRQGDFLLARETACAYWRFGVHDHESL